MCHGIVADAATIVTTADCTIQLRYRLRLVRDRNRSVQDTYENRTNLAARRNGVVLASLSHRSRDGVLIESTAILYKAKHIYRRAAADQL